MKNILAIETSCDETAASIISYDEGTKSTCIQSHVVESQNESHAPFGGVVPEIAARDHLLKIDSIVREALSKANMSLSDIHKIGVTLGPGLIGALMVGVMYARGVVSNTNIPLIGVNHVRAHLAPCFFLPTSFSLKDNLQEWILQKEIKFPILALTVSGGHCHITLVKSPHEHEILGRTLDDACGEAFDKVAKLLKLEYPGGPLVEQLAESANIKSAEKIQYTHPFSSSGETAKTHRYNFSYSGLKTATMNHLKKEIYAKADIAYAFQDSALNQLKTRVMNALNDYPAIDTLFIAGGVAQNKSFRNLFADIPCHTIFAPKELCSDNATMIALQTLLDDRIDATKTHPFARYSY